MKLTFWEYDELVEHFQERTDIWTQSEENPFLWVRTVPLDAEDQMVLALIFTPPASPDSPYRLFDVQTMPMAWDEAFCERYTSRLFEHWTTFSERRRIEALLRSCKVGDPDLLAIAICALHWTEDSDPDAEDATLHQERLWPDSVPPMYDIPDPLDIGTFILVQGGYVKLRLQADCIQVTLSVRSAVGGGFGPPLKGHVRPPDGRARDAAASISGKGKYLPDPAGAPLLPSPEQLKLMESK